MATPSQIAEKFCALDLHDDTVLGFSFHPAVKRGSKAELSIQLLRHWTGERRELRFKACANFQSFMDADVLVGNAPNNTCSVEAIHDIEAIQKFMRAHKRHWHVRYEKSIDPLPAKLSSAGDLVLFKVRFFGGALIVLAKAFSLKKALGQSQ